VLIGFTLSTWWIFGSSLLLGCRKYVHAVESDAWTRAVGASIRDGVEEKIRSLDGATSRIARLDRQIERVKGASGAWRLYPITIQSYCCAGPLGVTANRSI
jgi:hypothetical protein